ncbi:asparaginase [Paenibacillus mucilaginosus]|uniref:L-asparaginase, type II n=1 Tax=Paenibacillus mucilaginosus (strain KNP414) TaxID=1036673 RepID=F8FF11_PAEMK|nr:asparaginase [Paenibacillus mucilaginosus]AEI39711.1 L-asparaginase, type II [Paenibacillus mucilaginosus KNP414]MCG7218156.1 asparaginase [Paenibacillus mucilaginosus]WDM29006.1 asparaginase [Paenibacillus mucilaginosus]
MKKLIGKKIAAVTVLTLSLISTGCAAKNQPNVETKNATPIVESASVANVSNAVKPNLPNIHILTMGGTIAAAGSGPAQTTGYEVGVLTPDQLIEAVPSLKDIANLTTTQVAKMDSGTSNTDAVMVKLAKEAQKTLDDPKYDGVVITHGTDTLEETAYFLDLTVHSDKPIVFVGSMRPSTALSADGPFNLYNAVALAGSKEAQGKGVLISFNDKIGNARDTFKTSTTGVDTFKNPELGYLGYMQGGKPYFYNLPVRKHTNQSEFDIRSMTEDHLKRVDIVYSHANDDRVMVDAAVSAGAKGIIHAGTGNGSVHEKTLPGLQDAIKKGVVVVRGTRVPEGIVTREKIDDDNTFVVSDNLSPQKARILLMLALSQTQDIQKIQKDFNQY